MNITLDLSPTIDDLKAVAWLVTKRLSSEEYDGKIEMTQEDLLDIVCPEGTPPTVRKWLGGDSLLELAHLLISDFVLEKKNERYIRGYNALFPEAVLSDDETVDKTINQIVRDLECIRWL